MASIKLQWIGPASVCDCGHLGDCALGKETDKVQHLGLQGHGPCEVLGCPCIKFRWKDWTPEFKEALTREKARERKKYRGMERLG